MVRSAPQAAQFGREVNSLRLIGTAILLLGTALSAAVRLNPPAVQAFEKYVSTVEQRLDRQHASPDMYLALIPAAEAGSVRIEPVNGASWEAGGALLHHWCAAAFVPDASPEDMLGLLRDYNHLAEYYAPEVVSSHVLADAGQAARLAMRFQKRKVVTVVLDAEFEVQSGLAGPGRGFSISRSTHIWQVDRPGTPQERRRAEGADDGFLWRLNSYWSFEQQRNGLVIVCEAVSLTRDVPIGLGWLIQPIIQSLPRTSLEFTLTATKNALAARHTRRHTDDRAN